MTVVLILHNPVNNWESKETMLHAFHAREFFGSIYIEGRRINRLAVSYIISVTIVKSKR